MTGQRGKTGTSSSAKGSRVHGVDKIREILQHLQKVDSVVMEVRSKLDELEAWKSKLEENLYSYLQVSNNGNKSHDANAMNSPMNLHSNLHYNGFQNTNTPNAYGTGDFNQDLLGLGVGVAGGSQNYKYRIPNVPSTTGLFPDPQHANNNNNTTTSKSGGELMGDAPKITKERAATLKIIRTKIQQIYDSEECKSKYKCTDCLKTFDKWPNASKHIRLIHLREQRHKCPVCARDFYDKRSALAHQNTCGEFGADARRDQLMHK